MADCLMPNASPWRSRGTASAMNRLMAGWLTAFATPATASSAKTATSEPASPPIANRQAAVISTAPRIARSAPRRSASRPPGPAASAPAAKKTVTPAATTPTLASRSPRI